MAVLIDSLFPCVDSGDLVEELDDLEKPAGWWGKPNQFQIPLGRGPGFGWILLVDFDFSSLNLTIDHTITFLDNAGNQRTLQKITILHGEDITPQSPENDNSVFLCKVVDRRFHLARIPVDRSYNVAGADGTAFLTESLNSGVQWTWQTLVQDLATTLGLGTQTLPFTPDSHPENLLFFGCFAWEALNQVLDRLACTVKYDGETDTFSIIRLGDTAAAGATAAALAVAQLAQDASLTWNAYWNEPARGLLPEKIRVLFPRRPQPVDGSSVYYKVDVALPAVTGVEAGTFEILHDDLTAVGAVGAETNAAACSTRATERAVDWLRKKLYADARQTVAYRDFQAGSVLLCETTGTVIYDDRGEGMQTHVASGPDGSLERWKAWEQPLVLGGNPSRTTYQTTNDGHGAGSILVSSFRRSMYDPSTRILTTLDSSLDYYSIPLGVYALNFLVTGYPSATPSGVLSVGITSWSGDFSTALPTSGVVESDVYLNTTFQAFFILCSVRIDLFAVPTVIGIATIDPFGIGTPPVTPVATSRIVTW